MVWCWGCDGNGTTQDKKKTTGQKKQTRETKKTTSGQNKKRNPGQKKTEKHLLVSHSLPFFMFLSPLHPLFFVCSMFILCVHVLVSVIKTFPASSLCWLFSANFKITVTPSFSSCQLWTSQKPWTRSNSPNCGQQKSQGLVAMVPSTGASSSWERLKAFAASLLGHRSAPALNRFLHITSEYNSTFCFFGALLPIRHSSNDKSNWLKLNWPSPSARVDAGTHLINKLDVCAHSAAGVLRP